MKLVKMSLAAAMLMGASAYAIDNVKASGTASLFYHTQDESVYLDNTTPDMFDKAASNADIGLSLGATADLTTGVSAGITANALTTLGVEGTLVNGVWSDAHTATANGVAALGAEVDDVTWVSEAWLAGTVGKTTAKAGRMALDTPVAFSETWGIAANTFEAAVIMNQDIPDTTLVGAYVGKSNGGDLLGNFTGLNAAGLALTTIMAPDATFHEFYRKGAYAAAVVNNSWKPLTVQGWYYDVQSVADAYWLQADLNIEGILAGAQYANIDASNFAGAGTPEDKAYALMVGYALKDVATFKFAYSEVDDQGGLGGVGNIATATGQSKLYTELWWNFGAAQTGAKTYALTAEGTAGGVDLFAGYWDVEVDPFGALNNSEITEFVVTAGKSFGPLDATAAIIYDEFDQDAAWVAGDTQDLTAFQLYLTYNF